MKKSVLSILLLLLLDSFTTLPYLKPIGHFVKILRWLNFIIFGNLMLYICTMYTITSPVKII